MPHTTSSSAPGDQARTRRFRVPAFGLGPKLTLAFAATALMTLIAGLAGTVSFDRIAGQLDSISARSVPQLASALTLSAESAHVAATAARMTQATTVADLQQVTDGIAREFDALAEEIDLVRDLSGDTPLADDMSAAVASLRTALEGLAAAVRRTIELDGQLMEIVATGVERQRTVQERLVPMIDDIRFTLIIGAETAMASSAGAIDSLLGDQVHHLSAAQTARAEINWIYGILAQAATLRDRDQMVVLRNEFGLAVDRLRTALASLPDGEQASAIRTSAETLVSYGIGDATVFDRRSPDLRRGSVTVDDTSRGLTADYQALMEDLLPFVDEAYFDVVIGGETAMAQNNETISGLMDREVSQLAELLELQAEVNLIGGLLATGANETDPSQLQVLVQRFESARLEAERLIAGMADTGIADPAMTEAVAQLIGLGDGEDSVFSVRGRLLSTAEQAQSIVGDAAGLATAMGSLVDRSTADARSEVDRAALGVRSLIDGLTLLLYAVVALSVVLSIGIVWLFVHRRVVRTIGALGRTMRALAGGDSAVVIPEIDRRDELGEMARAVEVFRKNAVDKSALEQRQKEAEQSAVAEKRTVMHKLADEFEAQVGDVVQSVSSAASAMQGAAQSMSATAGETSTEAATVASAAEQAAVNVQTVAAATDELGSSIAEVSRQMSMQTQAAETAVSSAAESDQQIKGLSDQVEAIGSVVNLITAIAEQTNLLALNATIEAARAGDAGKGFAVVASEVKNLANQTAKATDDIAGQIKAVQTQTGLAVTAIGDIGTRIDKIKEISASVAVAVDQQNAAVAEIGRSTQEASAGTQQVSSSIASVKAASYQSGETATTVLGAAQDLTEESERLASQVSGFMDRLRSG